MSSLDIYKKIIAICNLIFISNYSLYILPFLINIRIKPIPYINTYLLILSYSTSILKTNLSEIFNQTNTYCLFVFITFPNNFLLFPFFLLSIHNMISFVLSNKKIFEKHRVYKMCRYMSSVHYSVGRFALMSEIVCSVLCLVMYLMGKASLSTVVAYFVMVRNQYVTHGFMRSVFSELKMYLDKICEYMPCRVQYYYNKIQKVLNQIN